MVAVEPSSPIAKPKRRITGRNGNGKAAPKTSTELTADVVQLAIRSRFSPIRGLTPQLLSVQLDQFATGYLAWAALTWDAIERRDDVLKGVASKRKKSVSRLQWEILTVDESPEASQHQAALQEFYDNISVVNAIDENERGGFKLLVRQMMDCIGKRYAVHEIVWKPGDVLTAEFRFVPLWFFENRTGRLRFLKMLGGGGDGEDLEPGGWMVTTGDGLMEACSVAYMFKNLPLKDWLSYSDKFGTPGVLGQTSATRESAAGQAMRDAVNSFGQNWGGVIYGADGLIKDPLKLIEASGEGQLPFPPLIERMDRAMVSLWRGSDLSTMSADNKGASVQGDEGDILLGDDADLVSEALNLQVDRWVIWQKFGVDRGLAYIKLVVPDKKDTAIDLQVDQFLLDAGAKLGERERREYYGRPEPAKDDTLLSKPAPVVQPGQDPNKQGSEDVPNIRVIAADQDLETFLGEHRDAYLKEFANDLHPLRVAIDYALRGVPYGPDQSARLTMLKAELPNILREMMDAPRTAGMMGEIIANAMKRGLESRTGEKFANAGHWITIRGNHILIKSNDERHSEEIVGSQAHPTKQAPDPATMKASEINKELDSLDARSSKLTDRMIADGRGLERPSDTFTKVDPLALEVKAIYERRSDLRNEIEHRYGPGAPSRLPSGRGFGPRKTP